METLASDYFVVKPANLHLTREDALRVGFSEEELDEAWGRTDDDELVQDGELRVPEGALIPGDIAEGWGDGGRVVHHLVHNRILAPVPAGSAEQTIDFDKALEALDLANRVAAAEERAEAAEAEAEELRARVAELEAGSEPEPEQTEEVEATEPELSEDEQAAVKALVDAGKPEEEALAEVLAARPSEGEPPIEPPAAGETFPQHKGGGVYSLSDGTEVKGKKDAIAAQLELDAKE